MEKLGGRFGRGRGIASVDGEVACEATISASSSRTKGSCADAASRSSPTSTAMPSRSTPCARRSGAARPDVVLVAGDLVLNGPDPAAVVDALREMEADGALIVQGNTDIAVADFDYAAAFPWMTDGVPDTIREAAEWAHDALGDERLAWLRRLPAERRVRAEDGTMILRLPRVAGLADRRASTRPSTPTSPSSGPPAPTPASSPAATPTCPRSATSAGSSSSTTAAPATSSTATRRRRGR